MEDIHQRFVLYAVSRESSHEELDDRTIMPWVNAKPSQLARWATLRILIGDLSRPHDPLATYPNCCNPQPNHVCPRIPACHPHILWSSALQDTLKLLMKDGSFVVSPTTTYERFEEGLAAAASSSPDAEAISKLAALLPTYK